MINISNQATSTSRLICSVHHRKVDFFTRVQTSSYSALSLGRVVVAGGALPAEAEAVDTVDGLRVVEMAAKFPPPTVAPVNW